MNAKKVILGTGVALMVLGISIMAYGQSPVPSTPPPMATAPAPPPVPTARSVMLTDQDIQTIIVMSNECVKARGLECAEAALLIKRKLEMPPPPSAPKP